LSGGHPCAVVERATTLKCVQFSELKVGILLALTHCTIAQERLTVKANYLSLYAVVSQRKAACILYL